MLVKNRKKAADFFSGLFSVLAINETSDQVITSHKLPSAQAFQ
jgi:hypothetical protein